MSKRDVKEVAECIEASNKAHDDGCELYTAWEVNFLESLRQESEEHGEAHKLSAHQWRVLDGLYQKAVDSPY